MYAGTKYESKQLQSRARERNRSFLAQFGEIQRAVRAVDRGAASRLASAKVTHFGNAVSKSCTGSINARSFATA